MRANGVHRALRQQRTKTKRHVRAVPHFLHCCRQQPGHALAAVFRIEGQTVPAGFRKLLIRLFPARWRCHALLRPLRSVLITLPVQRGEHFRREFAGLFKYRRDNIARSIFKPRKLADIIHSRDVLKYKAHIFHWGAIAHDSLRGLGDYISLKQFTVHRHFPTTTAIAGRQATGKKKHRCAVLFATTVSNSGLAGSKCCVELRYRIE